MTGITLAPVPNFPLPDDLAERDQWVLWRYEARDGKPTKVPYQNQRQVRGHDRRSSRGSASAFVKAIFSTCIPSLFRRLTAKDRTKRIDFDTGPESLPLFILIGIRIDLHRILGKLGPRERMVARLLMEQIPTEIARYLKISRAAVYRSIDSIRSALWEAGFESMNC